jgi:hypothetical protein
MSKIDDRHVRQHHPQCSARDDAKEFLTSSSPLKDEDSEAATPP